MNFHKMYFDALLTSGPPVYSGKKRSIGTCELLLVRFQTLQAKPALTRFTFDRNISILFKNKMIDVRRNHLELIIESNRTRDSAIRFYTKDE